MLRADAVRALGGYDEAMERAEDYDLWLRLAQLHAVAALPDLLYDWRDHGDGVGQRHLGAERARSARSSRRAAASRARWSASSLAGEVSAEHAARRALDLCARRGHGAHAARSRCGARRVVRAPRPAAPRALVSAAELGALRRARRALARLRGRAATPRRRACARVLACVRSSIPAAPERAQPVKKRRRPPKQRDELPARAWPRDPLDVERSSHGGDRPKRDARRGS
jgi:hypothetical protein